jgi:putative ABC transport system permease protein
MFLYELRYSFRRLRESPGPSLVSILCLGLGVGATVAAFAVVYSLLLRPLPFPRADRLAVLHDMYRNPEDGAVEEFRVSSMNFAAWRETSRAFEGLAAIQLGHRNLSGRGEPQRLRSAAVSASLFSVLGVQPLLGRTFLPEEDRRGDAAKSVLLSHGFWQQQLGSDPRVLGRALTLDGQPHLVLGVMPPGFRFPEGEDNPEGTTLWLPLGLDPDKVPDRQWHTLIVVGRLAPGVSLERARDEMNTVAARLAQEHPDTNNGWGVAVTTLRESLVGKIRPVLIGLSAVVGLVLLIACANLANLQLAHMLARRNELAIRTALGGMRSQLVRQLLTESLLLGAAGGLLGFLLARLGIPFLLAAQRSRISVLDHVRIDLSVFGFALVIAVVTGALSGLIPAFKSSGTDLSRLLRQGGRRMTEGLAGRRLQKALVVGEVALALVLLSLAGLAIKSLWRLEAIDPGFASRDVLTLGVALPNWRFPEASQRAEYVRRVLERVRTIPGVLSCGAVTTLPVGMVPVKARLVPEGRQLAPGEEIPTANHRLVSPGYLETMRIPLLRGRLFTESDQAGAPGVAIVSAEMARRYWPGQDPLGKRVKRWSPESDAPWLTVVGVVQDVKDAGIEAAVEPAWYLPFPQHDADWIRFVLRTEGDPLALAPVVRKAILDIDPDRSVYEVASVAKLLDDSLASRRLATRLLGLFASLGLALAAVGVYGIFSYLVSQRLREMGIRLALGASPGQVQELVLREGLVLAGGGLLLGLSGALALGKLFSSLLFEVAPNDPWTLSGASLVMLGTAAAACLGPARRVRTVAASVILSD